VIIPNQAPVLAHRQPVDLVLGHQRLCPLERLVRVDRDRVGRHEESDEPAVDQPLGQVADDDVAVGDDSDEAPVLADREERAAKIPLQIAEAGSDPACLAALLVEHGNPEVRADAAASLLAEGGTRAVAKLVEINLGATDDDPRVRHVRSLVAVAAEASERALETAQ